MKIRRHRLAVSFAHVYAVACVVKCCQCSCDIGTTSSRLSVGLLWQAMLLWQRRRTVHDYHNNAVHFSLSCALYFITAVLTCSQILFYTHTHTHLTALFPGLPAWAGTRKVKPIWISLKQETVSGSGISWAICKSAPCSRQLTTPAPHHSVFYRLDALPAAQPTASKHWRQPDTILHNCYIFWWLMLCHMAPDAIRLVPALFPGQMS